MEFLKKKEEIGISKHSYEEICKECNGKGVLSYWSNYGFNYHEICGKCKGRGKIDWIEKIIGLKPFKVETFYKLRKKYDFLYDSNIEEVNKWV